MVCRHIKILAFLLTAFILVGCEQKFNLDNLIPPAKVADNHSIAKLLFSRISTESGDRTCGLTTDQKFVCTGKFEKNGTSFVEYVHPQSWAVKDFDLGRYHVCAIFTGPSFDEVWCFGTGNSGQLGDGLSISQKNLVKVIGLPEKRFNDLGLGGTRSCVVDADGIVHCWGTGTAMPGAVATNVATMSSITDVQRIEAAYQATCLTKSDQSLWCWGTGGNGTLGQGNETTYNMPVQVKDSTGTGFLQNVTDFAVGFNHACAISDGEVYCWGLSRRAGLDSTPLAKTLLPRRLPELSGAIKIKSGDHHSCAQISNGDLYCWGSNRSLQIGGVTDADVVVPKKMELGSLFATDFSLGHGTNPSHGRTCIISTDQKIYCWGTAIFGLFGSVSPMRASSFQEQPENDISQILINKDALCLVSNDKAYAAGFDEYNQLGTGARYIVTIPQLLDEDPVSDLNCSHYANCYIKSGEMYCQGYRFTNREKLTPLGNNVVRAINSSHTTCALTEDDELKCWGGNSNGEVGINSTTATIAVARFADAIPQSPTMTEVIDAAGGDNFLCAIKSNKTVWCWGKNQYGTLGHNNPSEAISRVPVAVQGLPDFSNVTNLKLKISEYIACVLADAKVYCWGGGVGTILSQVAGDSFIAQEITALRGATHIAPIDKGLCAAFGDQSVRCLASSESLLTVFNKLGVHQYQYPKFSSKIKDLTGGLHMVCALLENGKRHCLGNNYAGGMHHEGIAPALIINPVNWHP